MLSMTDSQFRTFRADVRAEVRSIAAAIQSDIYASVSAEARRVAAATARKTVKQMTDNGDFQVQRTLNGLDARLRNVESEVTNRILKELPKVAFPNIENRFVATVADQIAEGKVSGAKPSIMKSDYDKPRPEDFVPNLKPKDFDACILFNGGPNPEKFTFFRGEWRRNDQMKEFARQACDRHQRVKGEFMMAEQSLLATVEELRKFTEAGF